MPKVFNGIKVWKLFRPLEDSKIMVFKPFLDLLAGVLEVIVLLENNIIYEFDIKLQGLLKFIFQYGHVKVPIHPSINLGCISHLIPSHGTPHYQISTFKLHCSLHHPITQPHPHVFPHIFPTIWPQTINFGLIRPYDLLSILNSPLQMLFNKFHLCPPIVKFK